MSGVFVWGPLVKSEVDRVRAFAERPENWYIPDGKHPVPGDGRYFVVVAGTTRAVFTWTQIPPEQGREGVIRHLSVSLVGDQKYQRYPLPQAVWTLAHAFGFTGAQPNQSGIVEDQSPSWVLGQYPGEIHAIVVQEWIEPQPERLS